MVLKSLSAKCCMQILEPEALTKAAIAEATAFTSTSRPSDEEAPDMVQLGQQAKQAIEVHSRPALSYSAEEIRAQQNLQYRTLEILSF